MLESSYAVYGIHKYTNAAITDLQCMIEPVKVELVDTILLFCFKEQYTCLITRLSLPE